MHKPVAFCYIMVFRENVYNEKGYRRKIIQDQYWFSSYPISEEAVNGCPNGAGYARDHHYQADFKGGESQHIQVDGLNHYQISVGEAHHADC